jgi:hypothetical protein
VNRKRFKAIRALANILKKRYGYRRRERWQIARMQYERQRAGTATR